MTYHSTKQKKNRSGGYVAIITAVVVTLIITLIAMVTSNVSYLGRDDTNKFESKMMSMHVAESCLDHARLKLAIAAYLGNETITVGSYSCTLATITTSGANTIITSTAVVDNKTTKLELTINTTTLLTVSMIEK